MQGLYNSDNGKRAADQAHQPRESTGSTHDPEPGCVNILQYSKEQCSIAQHSTVKHSTTKQSSIAQHRRYSIVLSRVVKVHSSVPRTPGIQQSVASDRAHAKPSRNLHISRSPLNTTLNFPKSCTLTPCLSEVSQRLPSMSAGLFSRAELLFQQHQLRLRGLDNQKA